MVGNQRGAGGRCKALFSGAKTELYLLIAGRAAEIRRRTAHIVNVALKTRVGGHKLGFLYDGFLAAGGDIASLMERKGTEIASAEAAAVVSDGEKHFVNGWHAARLGINRVKITHVRQVIDLVQLLAG